MVLHLALAAMLCAALLAVLLPLARAAKTGAAAAAASSGPLALHRERLAEIARDVDRGLLAGADAEAARTEAARLLLRNADQIRPPPSASDPRAGLRLRRAMAVAALVVVPGLALPLYALFGSPNLPSRPYAAKVSDDPAEMGVTALLARVEAHLADHPDDGRGFEVLAPVYMRLGRFTDAVRARAEALRLLGETPDRLADLAEARIAEAGGVVTEEASRSIARALALDPKHAKARFLHVLALQQDGKRDEAVAALRQMLADGPADAPWRETVRQRLAALTAPPGAAAVASLPPGAQGEAIRGMVEGLATRLAQEGGTAEDWSKLVRSYAVLGEVDKARAALERARAALPDEASRAVLAQVAKDAGIEAP